MKENNLWQHQTIFQNIFSTQCRFGENILSCNWFFWWFFRFQYSHGRFPTPGRPTAMIMKAHKLSVPVPVRMVNIQSTRHHLQNLTPMVMICRMRQQIGWWCGIMWPGWSGRSSDTLMVLMGMTIPIIPIIGIIGMTAILKQTEGMPVSPEMVWIIRKPLSLPSTQTISVVFPIGDCQQ